MVRGKIWFKCNVANDPVSPIIVRPSLIGWEAKNRNIDLVIERTFKGDELLKRMKGWITVDPDKVIELVEKYGKLKVIYDRELIVETSTEDAFYELKTDIANTFNGEVIIELI